MPLLVRRVSPHRTVEFCRTLLRFSAPLALAVYALTTAQAQSLYTTAPGTNPDVTVDTSVLDELGPPPNIPGLLLKQPVAPVPAPPPAPTEARHYAAPRRAAATLHRAEARHAAAARREAEARRRAETRHARRVAAAPVKLKQPPATAAAATPAQPVARSAATAPTATTLAAPAPQKAQAEPGAAPAIAAAVMAAPAAAPAKPAPAPAAPPAPTIAPPTTVATTTASPPAAAAAVAIPVAAPATLPNRASVIRFEPGVSDISPEARTLLDSLASRLLTNDGLRLQLVAFASGTGNDPIEARRISLARAVAVRAYLIEKGVHSFRMDVRALGNRTDGGGPADRVDLIVLDH